MSLSPTAGRRGARLKKESVGDQRAPGLTEFDYLVETASLDLEIIREFQMEFPSNDLDQRPDLCQIYCILFAIAVNK